MHKEDIMRILAAELPYLRAQYGVRRIALYGSFAQGTQTPRSDVDLLVELERPLGLEFVALADYLAQRLGRHVDLVTFETLRRSLSHPRYRDIAERIQRTYTDVSPTP